LLNPAELIELSEGALGAWTSETTGKGVLRGAVARLFLCSNGLLRTSFTQPRDDARETVREFLDRYPKPAYMSEVEHWRELSGGEIEFTMRRLRTAV